MAEGRAARDEAFERLGGRYDVRVLEPSPPAVNEGPFFADDPVAGGAIVPLERPGTTSWDDHCRTENDPELARWCAARWLGPWPRLEPLPEEFGRSRAALHKVAEHVVMAGRHAATGKIGLRFTYRGFGTPFFGPDRQVRVEGTELVDQAAGVSRRLELTTLGELAAALEIVPGIPEGTYAAATAFEPDAPLSVDAASARALGEWYGFCASILEQLRAEDAEGGAASRVQLWPEHFDMAVVLSDGVADRQANYGGSPGDLDHPAPYLYVGPFHPQAGPFWNEPFGASLSYDDILTAGDQRAAALAFLRHGRRLLQDTA